MDSSHRSIAILLFFLCFVSNQSFGYDTLTNRSKDHRILNFSQTFLQARAFPQLHTEQQHKNQFAGTGRVQPATVEQQTIREQIELTYDKIVAENRFIKFLDLISVIDLPAGIPVELGVMEYIIMIDSVVMTPTESFLFASMVLDTPIGRIHFRGTNIKFSKDGGLTGDGKLLLVGDYTLQEGPNVDLLIRGSNDKTYVLFDCAGYKQLSLEASLVFSQNIMLLEGPDGLVDETQKVSADFLTTVTEWNDILVTINVPKFQLARLRNFSFAITDAVIDLSDVRNPTSMKFPSGYPTDVLVGGDLGLWRGVFVKSFTITLPKEFKTTDVSPSAVNGRLSLAGTNLIIDGAGLTGRISALDVIPLEKGRMGNWKYSLDEIFVDLVTGEVTQGGFRGKVNIPLNKMENPKTKADSISVLTYSAIIKGTDEFLFTVSNQGSLNFDLWKAHVELKPSSYIQVQMRDHEFRPLAHLNGIMTINAPLSETASTPEQPTSGLTLGSDSTATKSKTVTLASLTFQDLQIQTVKPYVKIGSFSLGTGVSNSIGGFPLSINEITAPAKDGDLALNFDVTLSLVGDTGGGFGANGKFSIISTPIEEGSHLRYQFKKIELQSFGLQIDTGPLKFEGVLNFYKEDAAYGNGISGNLTATIMDKIKIQASAIFGTKNSLRYWYVDGLAEFSNGVLIAPAFALYGFGGGAYYHMRVDNANIGSPLGKTASGIVYVPDELTHRAFKATVAFGVHPGKKALNGDATLDLAFNRSGGLKHINFTGNAYFMNKLSETTVDALKAKTAKLVQLLKKYKSTALDTVGVDNLNYVEKNEPAVDAQVWASLQINYDFDNKILHSNFKTFINVAKGAITGAGPNGLAGEAVLHFAPGEWYIYIGRPEYQNRFALEVLGIARVDAYFVIGSTIPGSPPPPQNIHAILGDVDLDYMKDMNALKSGGGVGFGASFGMDTGDLKFLVFFARFAAGFGFDVMLKDYGDAKCVGGGQLGVNGWYANGQAYAFFEGKIGIRAKILKKVKKVTILEIGAAVLAQAMLPNPTWIHGMVGGKYSVLGGLVKGNCKFEVTIGKKCEIIQGEDGSALDEVNVVAEITPPVNAREVDVFSLPQAIFNYEMEKEYEVIDDNDRLIKFKISLDEFSLKHNNNLIKTDIKWNADKSVAVLNHDEILPGQKDIALRVVTSFKEKKAGTWVVSLSDNTPLQEIHSQTFTTAEEPDYIPPHNVAFSYPLSKQLNFYKNEYNQGFIGLKMWQSNLFGVPGWRDVVRVTSARGETIDLPLSIQPATKEIAFIIPEQLVNDQIYQWSILSIPTNITQATVDANVRISQRQVGIIDESEVAVTTKTAEGVLTQTDDKIVYQNYFRTSVYNTLAEKISSLSASIGWRDPIIPGVHRIGVNLQGPEQFSMEELGDDGQAALIKLEADLTNVPWYNQAIYPILYDGYPIAGRITISNRDPVIFGVVPTKSVAFLQTRRDLTLTESDIANQRFAFPSAFSLISYNLPVSMYYDYLDLANKAANYVVSHQSTTRLNSLLGSTFPVIWQGDYPVKVTYRIRGKDLVTSTHTLKIFNPIR
jgi:hypothetical protein